MSLDRCRPAGETVEKFPGKSRFAHTRGAHDRDRGARPPVDHRPEPALELIQLRCPSHQVRVGLSRSRGHQFEQSPRAHRFPFALDRQRRQLLGPYRVADQRPGLLTDQDLSRFGGLLQPGGQVDRVADGQGLIVSRDSGHHLACVDPDPNRDSDPPVPGELQIQLVQRVPHLDRCPHRAEGVVLMRPGHPEHGHDRVADEFLHRATVAPDGPGHLLEVADHQLPQRLGVERLAESGRADHVCEQYGDGLAPLPADRHRPPHPTDSSL